MGFGNVRSGDVTRANKEMVSLAEHCEEVSKAWGEPEEMKALLADVKGRMLTAFDGQERYYRWGAHYVRSLSLAHQLSMNINFLDPGLQVYGGHNFQTLKDLGTAVFMKIPMPKPSNTPSTYSYSPQPGHGAPT